MKYLIILFFASFPILAAAQFGTCNCSVSLGNNRGVVNVSTITWTGSGCPNASTTNYTGNLCISLGNGTTVNFDRNLTVTGDLQISGNSGVVSIPQNITLTVTGDFGDEDNNNSIFRVNGTLNVGGGIYGKNSNAFDAGGTGVGTISAGSLNFTGQPTCTNPATCTGINWDVQVCSPAGSFCNTVVLLPVSLLYFDVQKDGGIITAYWATATEVNSSHFIVEKSLDGTRFSEVARTDAAGYSSDKREYAVTDNNPFVGRTYYRLKQVDFDGTFEYFNMRAIETAGARGLVSFPSPWVGDHPLTFLLNFAYDGRCFVRIANSAGQLVDEFSFVGMQHTLSRKPGKGIYLVTTVTTEGTFVSRLVVP